MNTVVPINGDVASVGNYSSPYYKRRKCSIQYSRPGAALTKTSSELRIGGEIACVSAGAIVAWATICVESEMLESLHPRQKKNNLVL